jgi:hypothetical protein
MSGAAVELAHGAYAVIAFLVLAIVAGVTQFGPVSAGGRIAAFALALVLLFFGYLVVNAIAS